MPARFGSKDEGKHDKFIIDTATPYMAITSKDCENCGEDGDGDGIFDPDKSDSFEEIGDPDDPIDIDINSLSLEGYWGLDKVELEQDHEKLELEEYEFFVITHINNVDEDNRTYLDGVIGIGRPES